MSISDYSCLVYIAIGILWYIIFFNKYYNKFEQFEGIKAWLFIIPTLFFFPSGLLVGMSKEIIDYIKESK